MQDYRIPLMMRNLLPVQWKKLSFCFVNPGQGVRFDAAVFDKVKLRWRSTQRQYCSLCCFCHYHYNKNCGTQQISISSLGRYMNMSLTHICHGYKCFPEYDQLKSSSQTSTSFTYMKASILLSSFMFQFHGQKKAEYCLFSITNRHKHLDLK